MSEEIRALIDRFFDSPEEYEKYRQRALTDRSLWEAVGAPDHIPPSDEVLTTEGKATVEQFDTPAAFAAHMIEEMQHIIDYTLTTVAGMIDGQQQFGMDSAGLNALLGQTGNTYDIMERALNAHREMMVTLREMAEDDGVQDS